MKVYDDTTIVSIINRSHVGHEIKSSLNTDEFKKKNFNFLSNLNTKKIAKKMPPKKDQKDSNDVVLLLGRMATNLKVGIVGVPNVGKSTFFNVLTKSQAAAENFPFCTIDPNENKYHFF